MKSNELTLVLADRDVEDAKRILALVARAAERRQITSGAREMDPAPIARDEDDPREKLALTMFAARKARAELLPDSLSGQAAWDILLTLYLAEKAGVRHNISRTMELAQSPITTGLRYVDLLEAEGLAKRESDKRDGRIVYLFLSQRGRDVVNKILATALAS